MLTWKNDGASAGWSIILCNLVNFRFVHKSILLVSPQAWVLFLQKWNDLLCHTGKDHLSFLLCQSDCRPHPDCFHLSPLTLCLNGLPMSGASVFCLSACAPASGHSSVQPLSWFRSHAYFEFSPVETKIKKKKKSPLCSELCNCVLCPSLVQTLFHDGMWIVEQACCFFNLFKSKWWFWRYKDSASCQRYDMIITFLHFQL